MRPLSSCCALLSLALLACNKDDKENQKEVGQDSGLPSCEEGLTEGVWYEDSDGDGYGDDASRSEGCGPAEGQVARGGDCDDDSTAAYPGAEESDCADPVDYNCDGSSGYSDADADGIAACEDCDDSNQGRAPGLPEICDGLDNDCNEVVDYPAVDSPTWYIDYDGDGYGAATITVTQCEAPESFVANDEDCNDTSAAAYPGGAEVCDLLDNDCDGEIDGELAGGAIDVYTDLDGDGYGEEGTLVRTCDPAANQVEVAGDCDDAVAEVNPGAIEVCNDGIDNDCDTVATGCELELGTVGTEILGDSSGDAAGHGMSSAGDLNGDGEVDLVIGASAADGSTASSGAAYIVFGPFETGSSLVGSASVKLGGDLSLDEAGGYIAGPADFNGDGLDDVLITATRASDASGVVDRGLLFLVSGADIAGWTAGSSLTLDEEAAFYWRGDNSYDWLGGAVSQAGDINGDGIEDFLTAATADDASYTNSGTILFYRGSTTFTGGSRGSMSSAAARLYGVGANHYSSRNVMGVGDLDGDGQGDIAVGDIYTEVNGTQSGSAFVWSGQDLSGTLSLNAANAELVGDSLGDRLGSAFTPAGDLDGDGYDDFWVGASRDDEGDSDAGSAYLISGLADLSVMDTVAAEDVYTAKVVGAQRDDGLGAALEGDGDLDGDGRNDLVAGVAGAQSSGEGEVEIFLQPSGGFSGVLDAATDIDGRLVGNSPGDGAGEVVHVVGDLYGTGQSVLAVGAAADDNSSGSDAGAVWFVTWSNFGL